MTALAWALVAVPLAAGAALAASGRRGDTIAPLLGVSVAAVTLVLACLAAVVRPAASAPFLAGIRVGVAVDGLSAVLVVTTAAVTVAVLVFSVGDVGSVGSVGSVGADDARARFFGFMLLFAGAMLVTVTATTLPLLLMAWEVMGAISWALIGFWWREPRRVHAANVSFLTTRAADLGLYLAAGAALAGGVSTLTLTDLPATRSPWLAVVTAGVVVSALGKSAQLPFSFWLSRAMEGPSPVSALLHSATMVAAGAYLLLRLQPLLTASGWGEPVVAWVGATTALLLGLVAVAQRDLKQLLAASSAAQIGFMVLAAGAGGVAAGTAHLVAHAATKSLLFLAAGAWLTALGTKNLLALRGAARRYRLVGIAFAVGALALGGLPPLSLWLTKDEVLAAALHRGFGLYLVGLAAAAVSTVYSVKAVWFVWQPLRPDAEAAYDDERPGTRRVAKAMRPPLVVLATAAAVLGVLALPPVASALERLLDRPGEATTTPWLLALTALLAVGAAAGAWRWAGAGAWLPRPVASLLGGWLGLEAAAYAVVVAPTMRLARGLAAFDDAVLDRGVTATARSSAVLARWTDRRGELSVDGLVSAVARGAERLGRVARRPQTGQLHQYYAQAAAALGLLAVVFALVR